MLNHSTEISVEIVTEALKLKMCGKIADQMMINIGKKSAGKRNSKANAETNCKLKTTSNFGLLLMKALSLTMARKHAMYKKKQATIYGVLFAIDSGA
ncbi:hypothetical protein [Aliikangiella sp. G2MR2-5]|uniref:hypothetical protein n=1 Tax=Aliikangiella sp. G2MR2-5 TaxID=2788943 RepID=UPI0018AB3C8F|nr:hypothetical protein [Aliikangiella sp. G2MR2-5]